MVVRHWMAWGVAEELQKKAVGAAAVRRTTATAEAEEHLTWTECWAQVLVMSEVEEEEVLQEHCVRQAEVEDEGVQQMGAEQTESSAEEVAARLRLTVLHLGVQALVHSGVKIGEEHGWEVVEGPQKTSFLLRREAERQIWVWLRPPPPLVSWVVWEEVVDLGSLRSRLLERVLGGLEPTHVRIFQHLQAEAEL